MYPAIGLLLNLRCVAPLYGLFNNGLNDAVSDTTGDAMKRYSLSVKNIYTIFSVLLITL
ncbi:hypothetical protein BH11BAC6_BH11BAC6_04260 [soil metagenome]